MNDQSTILTRRIAFAEDWLARAKQQVEDGEQARGILTLLLAEAEVHRARELGTGRTDAWSPRGGWALGPVALVIAAAVIVGAVALWRPFGPAAWSAAAAVDSPHPIVTLAAGNGMLLRLAQPPEVVERTVTVPVAVRITVQVPVFRATVESAAGRHPGAPALLPPATVTQSAPRGPEVSPAAAVPPAVTESSALLSEAELIDLVLATERSLRRTTNQ